MDETVMVDGSTPVEVLEHLICQGAADLTAAERDWMLAIAEFDRREAHLSWAAPTCATWLSWYAGVDIRAARERVRVSRALAAHPPLSAAMATGQLSYSKVRAITRVATAETMRTWIDVAIPSTTNQLERLISAYRNQEADDVADEHRQQLSRCVDHHVAADGSFVITLRLPRLDGVTFLAAIEQHLAPPVQEPDGVWAPIHARRADAALDMALAATDHQRCTGAAAGDDALVTIHADIDTLERHGRHDNQVTDPAGDAPAEPGCCTVHGIGDSTTHPVAIPAQTALRMLCTSLVQGLVVDPDGNPLLMGRSSRVVRGALARAVTARDTCCRFPGCTRQGRLQFHHCGIYWSENGGTDIDNSLRLCRYHHRWVHEGGWHTVPDTEHGFVFRSPDGRFLPAAPAVHADPASVRAVGRRNAARPGQWQGDRLDMDTAIINITSHARAAAATQRPLLARAS